MDPEDDDNADQNPDLAGDDAAAEGSADQEKSYADLVSDLSDKDKPVPKTEPAKTDPDLEARLQRLETERDAGDTKSGMAEAVEKLRKNDDLKDVDPQFLEGFIHQRANGDKAVVAAFEARHKNPAVWDSVLERIGKDYAGKLAATPDSTATADLKAARDAARGISTTEPTADQTMPQAEMSALSPAEFDAFAKKEAAAAEGR